MQLARVQWLFCLLQACSEFSTFSAEDVASAFDPAKWTTLRFYQKFTLELPGVCVCESVLYLRMHACALVSVCVRLCACASM